MTVASQHSYQALLAGFQKIIDTKIEASLAQRGDDGVLTEACAYALRGGKRFRPALVFLVAEALGFGFDVSSAALAIEYFHTASLVADDLPCMDDDDERRGQTSVHKVYGEGAALLVTYALIAEGYHCLTQAAPAVDAKARLMAIENVAWNTGIQGASGGQYLDLFPNDVGIAALEEVICKKTVSLFEIAFVLGWIYGGGDIARLPEVKMAARHYGMAFQIADDFEDKQQDITNECQVNLALAVGVDVARQRFQDELEGYCDALSALGIASAPLMALATVLEHKVENL